MGMPLNLGHKLQLAPAKAVGGPDVPRFFFQCQLGLQNDHILRPSDLHGLVQQGGAVLIGAVQLPHPARVPGGEARGSGIFGLQILSGDHGGPFFRPLADCSADPTVQLHLRQSSRHETVQFSIHGAVVHRFSDVHWRLLSRHIAVFAP